MRELGGGASMLGGDVVRRRLCLYLAIYAYLLPLYFVLGGGFSFWRSPYLQICFAEVSAGRRFCFFKIPPSADMFCYIPCTFS